MSILHAEHTLFLHTLLLQILKRSLYMPFMFVSFNVGCYREDCMGICSFDSNCCVFPNNVHILGSWEGSWFQFLGSYSVHNSGSYHRVPNYPGTCTWLRISSFYYIRVPFPQLFSVTFFSIFLICHFHFCSYFSPLGESG